MLYLSGTEVFNMPTHRAVICRDRKSRAQKYFISSIFNFNFYELINICRETLCISTVYILCSDVTRRLKTETYFAFDSKPISRSAYE